MRLFCRVKPLSSIFVGIGLILLTYLLGLSISRTFSVFKSSNFWETMWVSNPAPIKLFLLLLVLVLVPSIAYLIYHCFHHPDETELLKPGSQRSYEPPLSTGTSKGDQAQAVNLSSNSEDDGSGGSSQSTLQWLWDHRETVELAAAGALLVFAAGTYFTQHESVYSYAPSDKVISDLLSTSENLRTLDHHEYFDDIPNNMTTLAHLLKLKAEENLDLNPGFLANQLLGQGSALIMLLYEGYERYFLEYGAKTLVKDGRAYAKLIDEAKSLTLEPRIDETVTYYVVRDFKATIQTSADFRRYSSLLKELRTTELKLVKDSLWLVETMKKEGSRSGSRSVFKEQTSILQQLNQKLNFRKTLLESSESDLNVLKDQLESELEKIQVSEDLSTKNEKEVELTQKLYLLQSKKSESQYFKSVHQSENKLSKLITQQDEQLKNYNEKYTWDGVIKLKKFILSVRNCFKIFCTPVRVMYNWVYIGGTKSANCFIKMFRLKDCTGMKSICEALMNVKISCMELYFSLKNSEAEHLGFVNSVIKCLKNVTDNCYNKCIELLLHKSKKALIVQQRDALAKMMKENQDLTQDRLLKEYNRRGAAFEDLLHHSNVSIDPHLPSRFKIYLKDYYKDLSLVKGKSKDSKRLLFDRARAKANFERSKKVETMIKTAFELKRARNLNPVTTKDQQQELSNLVHLLTSLEAIPVQVQQGSDINVAWNGKGFWKIRNLVNKKIREAIKQKPSRSKFIDRPLSLSLESDRLVNYEDLRNVVLGPKKDHSPVTYFKAETSSVSSKRASQKVWIINKVGPEQLVELESQELTIDRQIEAIVDVKKELKDLTSELRQKQFEERKALLQAKSQLLTELGVLQYVQLQTARQLVEDSNRQVENLVRQSGLLQEKQLNFIDQLNVLIKAAKEKEAALLEAEKEEKIPSLTEATTKRIVVEGEKSALEQDAVSSTEKTIREEKRMTRELTKIAKEAPKLSATLIQLERELIRSEDGSKQLKAAVTTAKNKLKEVELARTEEQRVIYLTEVVKTQSITVKNLEDTEIKALEKELQTITAQAASQVKETEENATISVGVVLSLVESLASLNSEEAKKDMEESVQKLATKLEQENKLRELEEEKSKINRKADEDIARIKEEETFKLNQLSTEESCQIERLEQAFEVIERSKGFCEAKSSYQKNLLLILNADPDTVAQSYSSVLKGLVKDLVAKEGNLKPWKKSTLDAVQEVLTDLNNRRNLVKANTAEVIKNIKAKQCTEIANLEVRLKGESLQGLRT